MTPDDDPFFIKATLPPISREREQELIKEERTGSTKARELLVQHNLRFVIKLCRGFHHYYGGPIEDYVQEGSIGLLRAIKKFDPNRGIKLITYAATWIRAFLQQFVIRNYSMIRIGTTADQKKIFFILKRVTDEFTRDGVEPSTADLAEILRVPEKVVISMQQRMRQRDLSFDLAINSDEGDGPSILSNFEGPTEDPEAKIAAEEEKQAVHEAVRVLSPRSKKVVWERLLSHDPRSLQAIGDELGISRERVRQLEVEIKDLLRRRLRKLKRNR